MTAETKTNIAPDTSLLVDGELANAGDVITAISDIQTELRSGRLLSVTDNDTHVGTLDDKLTISGSGIAKTEQNDAGNETLQLALSTALEALNALLPATGKIRASAIDSQASTSGYVLTANGSGGATFAAAGGGGAEPVDLTATAGEDLSERDMVFLNESDGEWYKIDVDATSTVLAGSLKGCVNESGGITENSTGSVRILGIVSGFTGITADARVYASTTAGGYTQTKPTVSSGGGQVAVAEMGYGASTTEIFIQPKPIRYIKRDTLSNGSTMTVEHHSDAQARHREVRAYVGSTGAGPSVASYSDSNQDAGVDLEGPTLAGDSITITASGTANTIGDAGGDEYRTGQQFTTVNGGELTEFTFALDANNGSPTGDITWQIMSDSGDEPDTELASGTKTPTASATNTVSSISVMLEASTKYWLVLSTVAQASDDRYNWQAQSSSVYAGGISAFSADGGSSWTSQSSVDNQCSFTISATTEKDKLSQSFEVIVAETLGSVDLWLKKTGSPGGTLTLRIETDNSGEPSGTLVHANATTTVSESSLGTSYADVTFTFGSSFSISGSTTYWLVLSTDRAQSDSNYVTWGADGSAPSYADGEMMSETSSTWSAESKDAVFEVFAEDVQYDEPCVIGRWTGGTRDIAVRFDDGSGSDPNIKTTIKNVMSGGDKDITVEIEVA